MSGQHVVYGFLRELVSTLQPGEHIVIVHYEKSPPLIESDSPDISCIPVPEKYRKWWARTFWENMNLSDLIREHRATAVLNVSGAMSFRCGVPVATLCQNPWCYVPAAHKGYLDSMKAALQRIGYRRAYRGSDLMIYISEHLRSLYEAGNPGIPGAKSAIANVGIDDSTFDAATRLADSPRTPFSILSVSAMASWKGADTLIAAVAKLRQKGVPAQLKIAGPWPDRTYREHIDKLVNELSLEEAVEICGKVPREELDRMYATSQVFVLLSKCESFGIPAAEAMCFGTPVVSTTECAISEICAPAGLFGPPEDVDWAEDAIHTVLTNSDRWEGWSIAAREKAAGLRWNKCAEPLDEIRLL